ncbi:MAG: acyl-CoA dehydrogenase family protein [Giesbergeria sp.]|jgi:putative acyl-CoA dehydrogenase|nr:acyl-CoA dehydrogenase family protein [Giesbergeria sp.]MBP6160956.1 acyl-CoA dehydrogenase family protein [Giesbergeria sp.]MBP7082981.1 acyl-CoA dehydrogenase family protein [Giesbergeria sp.]MBP9785726.1 acyl-CoA dehydrogenase family protein [Giesbergeria sp.]MBP9896568.1 acyl-CoA dehydrogenase family protein [Giesbergeria sp.]
MAQTHEVFNQFGELADYDLLATDPALREALARADAGWAAPMLGDYAARMGDATTYAHAADANRHTPELQAFDSRGRRLDAVQFHPGWHALMAMYRQAGLISLPFDSDQPGRWSAWAAGFYLHGQVEQGTLCPATMTTAAIPLLQREPALWAQLQGKLLSQDYDERDLPVTQKRSMWVGMGMTEKQGGSDVRANTTQAVPVGAGGRGGEYLLTGHKWFFSAPMCDAHLVVAQTPSAGPACFYVPRWRPDGSKNALHIQRLKDKLGNRSNSSSEVEFDGAWGILMGEEGRGIPTIIEMATLTRLNCVIGSAAIIRQALVQAIAYTRQREAFGRVLIEQPLMQTVLADMALESEAALAIAMRLTLAYEREASGQSTPVERAYKRILTPAAKFWVCKRAVELTGEAMEVFGGNGYVEEGVMARLFREAPVNSIWEGSGNVMCLDVLRALAREPEAAAALLADLAPAAQGEPRLATALVTLGRDLATPGALNEAGARAVAQRLVLLVQACLLQQQAPAFVADAFFATRFAEPHWGRVVGAMDTRGMDVAALLGRAFLTPQ